MQYIRSSVLPGNHDLGLQPKDRLGRIIRKSTNYVAPGDIRSYGMLRSVDWYYLQTFRDNISAASSRDTQSNNA